MLLDAFQPTDTFYYFYYFTTNATEIGHNKVFLILLQYHTLTYYLGFTRLSNSILQQKCFWNRSKNIIIKSRVVLKFSLYPITISLLICNFIYLHFNFRVADESLKRYARLHRQSRFPSVTWKHSKNQALLLRGASFHSRGVMGMIKKYHDGSHQTVAHTEMASMAEAERYIMSIIQNTPRAMMRHTSAW